MIRSLFPWEFHGLKEKVSVHSYFREFIILKNYIKFC